MIHNYSRVRLLTNKYEAAGAPQGAVGSIIETYQSGEYEVEFADEDGIDFAQIVAREEELQIDEPKPQKHVVIGKITEAKAAEISIPKQHKQATFQKP